VERLSDLVAVVLDRDRIESPLDGRLTATAATATAATADEVRTARQSDGDAGGPGTLDEPSP